MAHKGRYRNYLLSYGPICATRVSLAICALGPPGAFFHFRRFPMYDPIPEPKPTPDEPPPDDGGDEPTE